jgi:hypothetical protein
MSLPAGKSDVGLCAHCAHARILKSDKGSVFWMCQLSFTDSRYRKYPRLPVMECGGYEKKPDSGKQAENSHP